MSLVAKLERIKLELNEDMPVLDTYNNEVFRSAILHACIHLSRAQTAIQDYKREQARQEVLEKTKEAHDLAPPKNTYSSLREADRLRQQEMGSRAEREPSNPWGRKADEWVRSLKSFIHRNWHE